MKAAKDEIQRMIGTTAGVGNEYKEQSGGMITTWSGLLAMFNGAADLDQMQQFMQMQMQMNNPTFYQMPPPVESGEAKEGMGYPMMPYPVVQQPAAPPKPTEPEEAPPGVDDDEAPPGL